MLLPYAYQTTSDEQPAPRRNLRLELATGAARHGSSMAAQVCHAVRAAVGPGKLSLRAFVDYRLYETHHTPATRGAFIDTALHWPICAAVNDPTWTAVLADKWLTESVLTHHRIPTLRTLAIVNPQGRYFGRVPVVPGATGLDRLAGMRGPLFAKPVAGISSLGAEVIRQGDDMVATWQRLAHRGPMLLQAVSTNHQALHLTGLALATVRLYSMAGHTTAAVLKVPGPHSVADNLWRRGNSVALVDPATGGVGLAVHGVGVGQHTTPAPVANLPMWGRVLAIHQQCARMFSAVPYLSTDIAITPRGPVVVEVNYGGSFHLHQVASGTGFLTQESRAFFEGHGFRF